MRKGATEVPELWTEIWFDNGQEGQDHNRSHRQHQHQVQIQSQHQIQHQPPEPLIQRLVKAARRIEDAQPRFPDGGHVVRCHVLQGSFSQSALRSASLLVQEKATRHGWCGDMPGHQGQTVILALLMPTPAWGRLLEITTGLANIGGSSVLARRLAVQKR